MILLLRLTLLTAGITLLSACGNNPTQPIDSQPALQWDDHYQYMLGQTRFNATGKVAIQQANQRNSASLEWSQGDNQYQIFITGPLGQGAVRLQGTAQGVQMDISGEGSYFAQSPEALMQQRLGWSLPISNLRFWVKGIPAPGTGYSKALDHHDRLQQLRQNNWLIQYQSYHHIEGTDWPRKMRLTYGDDLVVTLVIKDWQAEPTAL